MDAKKGWLEGEWWEGVVGNEKKMYGEQKKIHIDSWKN